MKKICLFCFISALLSIKQTNCATFCDPIEFDRVFNIGHFIYFIRCGEVWVHNEKMEGGRGGFLRDFSLFTFARKYFAENVAEFPTDADIYANYSDKYLRFSGFSFQGLNCFTYPENLNKSCLASIDMWNGLTLLFDYSEIISAQLHSESTQIRNDNKDAHPLYLESEHYYHLKEPHFFLPNVENFILNARAEYQELIAALFDPDTNVLYMGLKYQKYYCITYLNMDHMIHNQNYMPRKQHLQDKHWKPNWFPTRRCFTGNLVGMFRSGKINYLVGEISYTTQLFRDQVYKMTINGPTTEVKFEEMSSSSPSGDIYHNLRTYFGCSRQKNNKPKSRAKRAVQMDSWSSVNYSINVLNNQTVWCFTSILLLVLFAIHSFKIKHKL